MYALIFSKTVWVILAIGAFLGSFSDSNGLSMAFFEWVFQMSPWMPINSCSVELK